MRFPPSLLDDIRARLPLSEVVARRVTWDRRKTQPSRGDFWACCPFHQEKSPSFHVDDRRGHYKCFGCGAGGDHFRFLAETEGLSFPEAVELLAGQAGIALPEPDPRAEQRHRRRAGLAEICEMAARFFERGLYGPTGAEARAYLERRAFTNDTLREFRFGLAPDSRDALKRHLVEKGVDETDMVEAGLLIRPDNGRPAYDRFRNRIIIPIQDERAQVIAFGGRALDPDGQPKYLNSPETPLFHKGSTLFNLHRARQPAFEAQQAIVTEGYLDAIAVWQAGVRHVVASLGTAFTEDQIARMWRLAPEPIICFDGDAAGTKAVYRAVDRILPASRSGHSFQFCTLPQGQDPDDLIKQGGRERFLAEVGKARPLSQVLWEREVSGRDIATPERKAALEKSLYDLIASIRDERVRRRYQLEIRLKLSNLFWESGRAGRKTAAPAMPVEKPAGALFSTERTICGLCTRYLDLFEHNVERIARIRFNDDLHEGFKAELCRLAVDLDTQAVSSFFDKLDPRFYEILHEVMVVEPQAGARLSPNWTRLSERLQVLNCEPSPDFIERCFEHYLDELELGQFAQDLEQELKVASDDIDERSWTRIQSLKQDLLRRRQEQARRDHDLAEEAKGIRASHAAHGLKKTG